MDNKGLLISVAILVACAGAYSAYKHYQGERQLTEIENARVELLGKLPALPFERSEPLSADQKSRSASVSDDQAVLAAIANKSSDVFLDSFYKAAYQYKNGASSVTDGGDKFKKRDLEIAIAKSGPILLEEYKALGKNDLLSQKVSITLAGSYDFQRQQFLALIKPQGGEFKALPFKIKPFRDTDDPPKVLGMGASALERAASQHPAYLVSKQVWKVPEDFARALGSAPFTFDAIAYYDVDRSLAFGDVLLAHCAQLDIYKDSQYTQIVKSSGCDDLNVKRKW